MTSGVNVTRHARAQGHDSAYGIEGVERVIPFRAMSRLLRVAASSVNSPGRGSDIPWGLSPTPLSAATTQQRALAHTELSGSAGNRFHTRTRAGTPSSGRPHLPVQASTPHADFHTVPERTQEAQMRHSEGWTVVWTCDRCGTETERREANQPRRSGRPRRWCSDACRVRAARAKKSAPPPTVSAERGDATSTRGNPHFIPSGSAHRTTERQYR